MLTITTDQLASLVAQSLENFSERLISDLTELDPMFAELTQNEKVKFTQTEVNRARNLKLYSEWEIAGYVFLAWQYGINLVRCPVGGVTYILHQKDVRYLSDIRIEAIFVLLDEAGEL